MDRRSGVTWGKPTVPLIAGTCQSTRADKLLRCKSILTVVHVSDNTFAKHDGNLSERQIPCSCPEETSIAWPPWAR
jgi:hypothetical protein